MLPKSQATKEKIGKLDFINTKHSCASNDNQESKDTPQNGRMYLQGVSLMKVQYAERRKNAYSATMKNNPIFKWAKALRRHFSKKIYMYKTGRQAYEMMLDIISH